MTSHGANSEGRAGEPEAQNLQLSSADPADSPEFLDEMIRRLSSELPATVGVGGKFLRGKAEQETAHAAEIRVRAVKMLADMENERARLRAEHRFRAEELARMKEEDKRRHEERMFELETERLGKMKDVIEAFAHAKAIGLLPELKLIVSGLLPPSKD